MVIVDFLIIVEVRLLFMKGIRKVTNHSGSKSSNYDISKLLDY